MKKYVLIILSLFSVSTAFACEKDSSDINAKKDNIMGFNTNVQARQIADPILHSIPKPANFDEKDKINSCIKIMKKTQEHLGGVGIACNQCFVDEPLQIIFIGSDDLNLREAAQKRYPNETLPNLIVMINPTILEYSDETYFPGEGCLSIAGSIRGKVLRHKSVIVEYYNIDGEKFVEKHSGFAAHIIQHESDHLNGIEYLQKALNKCSQDQKNEILDLIDREINYRKLNDIYIDSLEVKPPVFVFDVDSNDQEKVVIDFLKLEEIFKEMLNTTLLGIKKFL